MSELLQFGHPDADQLIAFVEHVLPAHEREETLAHLAICPDCRAVVAQSMPPFEETLPQPGPIRIPWFSGWRLLWTAGAAAALVALVAAGIHLRNLSTARIEPSASPIALVHTPPPVPARQPQAAESKQRKTILPDAANPARRPASPSTTTELAETSGFTELPLEGRSITPNPTPRSLAAEAASASSSADHAATELNATATDSPLPQGMPATGNTAAAAPPFAGSVGNQATTSSFMLQSAKPALQQPPVPDLAQAILSGHPLPSGLPALSIVTSARQNRTLAIDTRGQLFLSDDFGAHWNPVPLQWAGKAVKVSFVAFESSRRMGIVGSSSAKQGPWFAGSGTVVAPAAPPGAVAPPSLSGTITDAAGAVVPGATVIVSASPTQLARLAKTDMTGHYVVDNLSPGTYLVEADARGFNPQKVGGVAVAPDKPGLANLSLQIGGANETVTVSAAPPEVQVEEKAAPAAKIEPPPPTFEITTDTGERWVSPDGQTWNRK